jgi:hypothetical protein
VIKQLPILLLLITCTVLAHPTAFQASRSCRQHPQLVGKCFHLRGRLSVYNGAPALRLWRVGTQRMLGISEQRFAVTGYRNIPDYLEKEINQDVDIFGDFEVCPFTRSQPREMQLVCIESGKNLVVRPKSSSAALDLTGASDSELQQHLGQTIIMRGKFSLRGKLAPLILVGSRPIYLVPSGAFSWAGPYGDMEGQDVRVTGAIRFARYSESGPGALPVGRPPDHFYFEAETAKIEMIPKEHKPNKRQ